MNLTDVIFKTDLNQIFKQTEPAVLELVSGGMKNPGRICMDQWDMPNVDMVSDLENGLPSLPDNSVDVIHSKSFLEHIDHFDFVWRKSAGHSNPTGEKSSMCLTSQIPILIQTIHIKDFWVCIHSNIFPVTGKDLKRKSLLFYQNCIFTTEEIKFIFTSPWKGLKSIKRLFQKFINLHPLLMEL